MIEYFIISIWLLLSIPIFYKNLLYWKMSNTNNDNYDKLMMLREQNNTVFKIVMFFIILFVIIGSIVLLPIEIIFYIKGLIQKEKVI